MPQTLEPDLGNASAGSSVGSAFAPRPAGPGVTWRVSSPGSYIENWEVSTMTKRWRTVDVVIASVLAVAFGVVFWAWGLLYEGPANAIPLPGRALLYGVWLVPAVLAGLIIRKPGAAAYTETLAA